MTSIYAPDIMIRPMPDEEASLEHLSARLAALARTEQPGIASLISPTGEEMAVPESVYQALQVVVRAMAMGQTITLVPHGHELTTREAADILHVSRPFLIAQLLDTGEIPHHRVGNRRRLYLAEVMAYRERRAQTRAGHLRRLTQLAEDSPGGYQ